MAQFLRLSFSFALVWSVLSLGAGTMLGPDTALAQTATNLRCDECVNRADIKKGAVSFNRLQDKVRARIKRLESKSSTLTTKTNTLTTTTNALTTTTNTLNTDVQALETDVQNLQTISQERVPFYVVLDGDGAEQVIATNGPLEYFVRCTVGTTDVVELIATSSQAGWFGDGDGGNVTSGTAGAEMVAGSRSVGAATASFGNDIDESFAVAPDGSYMAVNGEMLALGLNVFGHDCVAVGNVFVISGTP